MTAGGSDVGGGNVKASCVAMVACENIMKQRQPGISDYLFGSNQ